MVWSVVFRHQSMFSFYPFSPPRVLSYCFSWLRQLAWTNLPFLAQHQRTARMGRTFFRARICKRWRSPWIDYEESIPPAYDTLQRNPIYLFLFWELRCLSPNVHIHVPGSDLYISRIGPHLSCSRIGRSIVGMHKSLTDTWMWKLGLWSRISFSGNIFFEFLYWFFAV